MCGRYSLEIDDTFYPRFDVTNRIEIKPNFNISPYSFIPVIVRNSPKKVLKMKWGFVPAWSKEFNSKYAVINTRAETIDESPYFKNAFRNTRCLIPATGFYEWRKEGKEKIPFYIHLKDNSYFSFAGIYSVWEGDRRQELYTCSIVTTDANDLMKDIHDRMPVILSQKEEELWVDENIKGEDELKSLLDPYPASKMEAYEVSSKVNSVRSYGRGLINPA